MHLVPLYACFPLREGLLSRRRPSYGICNSKERNTPDNLKRLGSITKQISTTTYNTYDSLQFNSHRSFRGKKESKKEKGKKKHTLLSSWRCSLDARMKQALFSRLLGLRRGGEHVLRRVWESIIPLKRHAGPVGIAWD